MKAPRGLKVLAIGAGSLLALMLLLVVVGYLSAPHLYLTRAIFWGESDYKDHEKFPARTIHNVPPTSRSMREALARSLLYRPFTQVIHGPWRATPKP
jgi:hypothetical protein